jgi:hypothetical protein
VQFGCTLQHCELSCGLFTRRDKVASSMTVKVRAVKETADFHETHRNTGPAARHVVGGGKKCVYNSTNS